MRAPPNERGSAPEGRPAATTRTVSTTISAHGTTARPPVREAVAIAALEAHRRAKALTRVLAAAESRQVVLDDRLVASLHRLASSGALWSARASELAEAC